LAADATQEEATRRPDCVYVPTPYDVVEKMLDLAKLKTGDVVFDLGCGDGRVVVQAARKRGCRGVGFEIVPELVREARANARQYDVEHLVEIRQADLFKVDFQEATVVPMYLLPDMIVKLTPKLEGLKPGTRIVAHDYYIQGIKADEVVSVVSNETNVEHNLYVYTTPLVRNDE
jgi:SAM-dependent methyltransferase